jgi:hypothetical protein
MQTIDTSTLRRLENLMIRLGKPLALATALGLGVGVVGCESENTGGNTQVEMTALHAFNSCDDLLDYFHDEALTEVQHWGWISPAERGGAADDQSIGAPTAGGEGGENNTPTPAFSETNNQEAAVDEPDVVKTDGRYIYGVRGRQLLIYQAEDLSLLSEVLLPAYNAQILLDGDRLAVIYNQWGEIDGLPEGLPARLAQSSKTGIEIYDVADRAAPAQLRKTLVEGNLITARLVDGTARVVVHFNGAGHVDWQPWEDGSPPSVGGGTGGTEVTPPRATETDPAPDADGAGMEQRRDGQEVDVEAAWRQAVEDTVIEDWIPFRVDTAEGETTAGPLGACRQFHRPGEAAGHGVTAVVSVDLDRPDASFADPAVVTAPGVTYASAGSLYLTTVNHAGWLWGAGDVAVAGEAPDVAVGGTDTGSASTPDTGSGDNTEQRMDGQVAAAPEREATQIHKLSIGEAVAPAAYRGSGRVYGTPLNQFSMGEHAAHLRIATTENTLQGETTNHLFVLGEAEGALSVTGQITDLAATERIYAVRLMGERGFMVTFRQVDPLFTMDLSDPANPLLMGELKIPGFSTYLHPYGLDHLIGIGQSANEEGRVTGMQLSLFDVSDLANPAQAHVLPLGEGWSQALYDHHAFMFWAPTDTLAIPVERWENEVDGNGNVGLALYDVDVADGFAEAGFISHDGFGEGWAPSIERSLVIGDAIYAFSRVGVTSHTLEGLAPVASAAFPDDAGDPGREQPVEPGDPGEPIDAELPDDRDGDQGGDEDIPPPEAG